jgi:hypothetical protein
MESQKKKLQKSLPNTGSYKCDFCSKTFVRRQTFINHSCMYKQRFENRHTEISQLAYKMWCMAVRHEKTEEKFEHSKLYKTFHEFASFCHEQRYIAPLDFANWLMTNQIIWIKWFTNEMYTIFLKQYVLNENPRAAVIRSIAYIQGLDCFGSFFREYPVGKILMAIESGNLSPWLVILYPKNEDFFNRLEGEKLDYFVKLVNMNVWNIKVNRFERTIESLKNDLEGCTI